MISSTNYYSSIAILLFLMIGLSSCREASNTQDATKEKPEIKAQNTTPEPTDLSYKMNAVGIFVEDFPDTMKDPERYNRDNKIYRTGRSFIYEIIYKDKSGQQYFFEVPDANNVRSWQLVPAEKANKNTIKKIRMVVQQGLEPYIDRDPQFNMSVLGIEFMMDNDFMEQKLLSTLVENEKNLWITPPRDFIFKVLELSPYPFVWFPVEKRRPWVWKRGISDRWSDPAWMEWKGRLKANYKYTNHGHRLVRTKFGDRRCYELHAMAALGKEQRITKLNMLFNQDLGFIKLDYLNIDSSTLVLNLVEVQE